MRFLVCEFIRRLYCTLLYGRDLLGRDWALRRDKASFGERSNSSDGPTFAAMGGGIFADLGDDISVVALSFWDKNDLTRNQRYRY
ncbi:MAG: hypothetical protein ACE5PV_18180 [Candidatus Poribacteria bacterium]